MKNLIQELPDQIADDGGTHEREQRLIDRRKVVAFDLAEELYGLDIGKVSAILSPLPAMPIPRTPAHVIGIINLRGGLLPLIDLRIIFDLPVTAADEETHIVVVENGEQKIGIIVDRVWELLRLSPQSFQPAPARIDRADLEYFPEVAAVKERMLIMIDIDKLIADTTAAGIGR